MVYWVLCGFIWYVVCSYIRCLDIFFPRMWMSVLMYICVGTSLLGSVRMVSSLVSVMLSSCGWGCVDELCFVVV